MSCVALVAGLFSPFKQNKETIMNWYKMFDTRAEAEAFALAHDLSPQCVTITEAIGYGCPDSPDTCERWTQYAVAYND